MSDQTLTRCRFVVLISGRGSNMCAIIEQARRQQWPAEFVRVISNRPDALGVSWANAQQIPTSIVSHKDFASRQAFDEHLAELIDQEQPDYVLLAGFMRILTPAFVRHYAGRLINIHPSLLPAFGGLHTHERALAAGVGWHGCTVHFVTEEVDGGPIIAQAALPVHATDTSDSLEERVLQLEHQLYPAVVKWLAHGQVELSADGHVNVHGVTERHFLGGTSHA